MKTGSAMAASQTENHAGYRLVKTSSLVFWPSTDTGCKHRASHLLVWDAVLQAHPSFALKNAPEAGFGTFCGHFKKTCGLLVGCMLLSTSWYHGLMRPLCFHLVIWKVVYADGLANLRSALVCKPEVLWRLAKRKNLRGIDRLKLVLWSSGRRRKHRSSHLLVWDAVLQGNPLFALKNALEAGFGTFCDQIRKPAGHW